MGFGNIVSDALNIMRDEKKFYKDYLPQEAITVGNRMVAEITGLWENLQDEIIELLKTELPMESPYAVVWWYSVLLNIKHDEKIFEEFILYVRKNRNAYSANTKYFLFYQMKSMYFRFAELSSEKVQKELLAFFEEIVEDFSKEITVPLERIPLEERNPEKALIITEQFIAIQNGPTKTALDRCKCLMEKMNKQVLLLNTTEILSQLGRIPFYNAIEGSYDELKKNETYQEWKQTIIPYFQCDHCMPETNRLDMLLREIRVMAPQIVVSIGGSGMLCNLVNKMIPVVTVGLCPSDLEFTTCKYQTLGRKITEKDRRILDTIGYTEQNVIESIFTSSLKPQTEIIGREEMNVEKSVFALVTVGVRLDDEITDDFLDILEQVVTSEVNWVIIGNFAHMRERLKDYSNLKKYTINIGFCNDILSRIENCDLYVNPTRKGGGTSCVEAMYKGLPVVSVNYGDVAVNAGDEFCVSDYEEMKKQIMKYYTDKEYYLKMSNRAKERVKILLDTDSEFERIIREVELRETEHTEGDRV